MCSRHTWFYMPENKIWQDVQILKIKNILIKNLISKNLATSPFCQIIISINI